MKRVNQLAVIALVVLAFILSVQSLLKNVSWGQGGLQVANATAPTELGSLLVSDQLIGNPIHLKIPEIKVDAVVKTVGLTGEGAMDTTESPDDVGWFELGPRPGETGSAVIAGHYTWKNGRTAVFDQLDQLRPGDRLYIQDDTSHLITFMVRESRKYDPHADASEVFSLNDGYAHLNLITCGGTWNQAEKRYTTRLVVFTDMVVGGP